MQVIIDRLTGDAKSNEQSPNQPFVLLNLTSLQPHVGEVLDYGREHSGRECDEFA